MKNSLYRSKELQIMNYNFIGHIYLPPGTSLLCIPFILILTSSKNTTHKILLNDIGPVSAFLARHTFGMEKSMRKRADICAVFGQIFHIHKVYFILCCIAK